MARPTDPPPPRSPFLLPPPRPQLPPPSPALQQRAWAALALSVLGLLAMTLISNIHRGVYVIGVSLAVAIVALALAIMTMSAAKRAGTRRPRGVVAATILGLVGFVFCSFALAGFLVFRTELSQYANCMSGANTTATQTACQNQLDNSVRNEIKLLGGN
jgi:ABC-type Fe3+-siderophore transport system permease subunit